MEYRGFNVTEQDGKRKVSCQGCTFSAVLAPRVKVPSNRAVLILARCRETARCTNVCSGACYKHPPSAFEDKP